jgi:hypothetical protein
MQKRLVTLVFCLCFIALSLGDAVGQSDETSKALETIIYAAPDKFEKLRSGKWEPATYGGTKAQGKAGIPGIDRNNCRIYDGDGFYYQCSLGEQSASQARQLYQQIKESLPPVLSGWKFHDEDSGGNATFLSAPVECRVWGNCPINLSFRCENQNSNSCSVLVVVYAGKFSVADLPKNRSKLAQDNKKKYPPCGGHPGFANTTLAVVTTVKPESGKTWKFPEAASVIASRVLRGLNQNTRNIVFKEASGVTPNFVLNVTLIETSDGTLRDTAYVEVTGLGEAGVIFRASSGEAPFTGALAAVDKLSTNMLRWFENGWGKTPPCVQADGSLRTQ